MTFALCSGATERARAHFYMLCPHPRTPWAPLQIICMAVGGFFTKGRQACLLHVCIQYTPAFDILLWHSGDWETKVSNREKRQQKRKEKGTGDGSPSPGGVEPPATTSTATPSPAPEPVKATSQKKSKGTVSTHLTHRAAACWCMCSHDRWKREVTFVIIVLQQLCPYALPMMDWRER